jgi:hypothetical protein
MDNNDFLQNMKRFCADIVYSQSAFRNQGAPGIKQAVLAYIEGLDLSPLKSIPPDEYNRWLDERTEELRLSLPEGAKNWGTARKGINIFMVQVFLNRYLSQEYAIDRLKDVLETPLDSYAATNLIRFAKEDGHNLPDWGSVKNLTKDDSDKYQWYAAKFATKMAVSRACLDILLWKKN